MIKKEISFEDFDGNAITEVHYFHMSKIELIDSGLDDMIKGISLENDTKKILAIFKTIVAKAYGKRVEGNSSKFVKSSDISDEFIESLAFDALLTELMANEGTAAEFVTGLVPKDLLDNAEVTKAIEEAKLPRIAGVDQAPQDSNPEDETTALKAPRDDKGQLVPWAFREPTHKEMTLMSHEQLLDVMHRKSTGWVPRD